jgi:hypothetical protein
LPSAQSITPATSRSSRSNSAIHFSTIATPGCTLARSRRYLLFIKHPRPHRTECVVQDQKLVDKGGRPCGCSLLHSGWITKTLDSYGL